MSLRIDQYKLVGREWVESFLKGHQICYVSKCLFCLNKKELTDTLAEQFLNEEVKWWKIKFYDRTIIIQPEPED